MEAPRRALIDHLWAELLMATKPEDVTRLTLEIRREYSGVEEDARALGFGRGYEVGFQNGAAEEWAANQRRAKEAGQEGFWSRLARFTESAPATPASASASSPPEGTGDQTLSQSPDDELAVAMLNELEQDLAAGTVQPS